MMFFFCRIATNRKQHQSGAKLSHHAIMTPYYCGEMNERDDYVVFRADFECHQMCITLAYKL